MKIAHLSDLHLFDLYGVPWRTLVRDKRITGYANLVFKRRRAHQIGLAQKLAQQLARSGVDHVVITGDLTNLSLGPEERRVEAWLREDLTLPPDSVSVVPGNHDRYTQHAACGTFERTFAPYMRDDRTVDGTVRFPFVRCRGPAAIIGLDSAVPQPWFVAAGELGNAQRRALRAVFQDPEVRRRTPVLLLHHPPGWNRSWVREMQDGLRDAAALQATLPHRHGLLLHGHLHRTVLSQMRAGTTKWIVAGAPSASNTDMREGRVAGFNTYELDRKGVVRRITSTTLSVDGQAVVRTLTMP